MRISYKPKPIFSFHCHICAQRIEINQKWLLLPQEHKVSKNKLSSVIYGNMNFILNSFFKKYAKISENLA